MSAERQTVAGAYQKIESHEDLCALRYGTIETKLSSLESSAKQHERAAWGVVMALVAWMGVQLYNEHARPLPVTTVVTTTSAGK